MLKLVLNQATCKELRLEMLIKNVKGFRSLELDSFKLNRAVQNDINLNAIKELMASYDIEIESLFGLKDFSLNSEKLFKRETLPSFQQMMSQAYKLETGLLIVTPSLLDENAIQAGIPQWRILKRTENRLKFLLKKAFENGLKLGFEFLSDPFCSLSNASDLKELFERLEDKENLGIVTNVVHLARDKLDYAQLKDLSESLLLFRLSDFKFKRFSEGLSYKDAEKQVSEKELFDFKEFFRWARKIGYRRPYSIILAENDCSKGLYQKVFNYLYPLFRTSEDPT